MHTEPALEIRQLTRVVGEQLVQELGGVELQFDLDLRLLVHATLILTLHHGA